MFKGKIALVTGGNRGIGKAIVLKLAENGADIAILYAGNAAQATEVCEMATALGVKAHGYCCDVSDLAAVKETVGLITKELGGVDILVNNAGVTKDGLMLSMKEADYDTVLDINLKGTFNTIKCCYSGFLKKKAGKIINISSISGILGNAGQVNYAASKAGVIGLTKSVARELASRGICCNAIAPGYIETEMTEDLERKESFLSRIPLGRMGLPEDVADLAVFLASDKAKYITGEVIRVDGGMAI